MPNEPAVRGYVVGPGGGVPDRTPDVKASGRSTGGSLTVMELAVDGGPITRQDVAGSTAVCNDTVLTVTSGILKIVTHEALTPSGAYHLGVEGNAQGVHAVAPTGAAYQLPGGFWMEMNVTPGATTHPALAAPPGRCRSRSHPAFDQGSVSSWHVKHTCRGSPDQTGDGRDHTPPCR